MPVCRIARSLAGALLVCGSALADEKPKPVVVTNTTTNPVPTTLQGPVTVQGTATVNVSNTAANPVPTTAQGTTQISGAVHVLSAPPVTGSVAVSNQPTVNLAPGSTVAVSGTVNVANQPTVSLAPNTSVGIAGTPSVNLAGTPTVGLAAGSSVAVSSLPGVQITGTPSVQVTNLPLDSSGNLKVTSSGAGAAPAGRFITLNSASNPIVFPSRPGTVAGDFPPSTSGVATFVDTSDCRSLTLFYFTGVPAGGGFIPTGVDAFLGLSPTANGSGGLGSVTGTNLGGSVSGRALVQAFLIPGTSAPAVTPFARITFVNNNASSVTLFDLQLYCSR